MRTKDFFLNPALVVFLLLAPLSLSSLSTTACSSTRAATERGEDNTSSESADETPFLRSVAPITGRLILPSLSERRPDGAVRLQVNANAENRSLAGKTVWIRWDSSVDWAREVVRDVSFSPDARKSMAEKGNIHPKRLDGWSKVSALESLAGSRDLDDVEVSLSPSSTVVDTESGELVLREEPTQIAGSHYALVRFAPPAAAAAARVTRENGEVEREVVLFNPTSKKFDGPRTKVLFAERPRTGGGQTVQPLDGIENSSLNALGFYVYGDREEIASAGGGGRLGLHVRSIEPRYLRVIATRTTTTQLEKRGHAETVPFVTSQVWADEQMKKGSAFTTLLSSTSSTPTVSPLAEGTELLVTHLFGAIGPGEANVRTGHFAFGVARIERQPLTGELELAIRYKQIYAHNAEGILSGTHSWASYQGSLVRGHAWMRPTEDVALAYTPLTRTYDFASLGSSDNGAEPGAGSAAALRFRPMDGLVRELDAMAARYRIGNGTGASIVTPANSCVQDSSQALYFALLKLEERVRQAPRLQAALAAEGGGAASGSTGNDSESISDFKKLIGLAGIIERYLSPLGVTREDWRANANKLGAVDACPGGTFGAVVCGLASYKTIFPRTANDLYLDALLTAGASGVVLRTNQIGGEMPAIYPLAPSSPLPR